eukprot:scaffold105240_cov63-Phaeocystis_antarctica.AAC.3
MEKVKLLSNKAECCLRTEAWEDADGAASLALVIDTTHAKSLLRRAKARVGRADVAVALSLSMTDKKGAIDEALEGTLPSYHPYSYDVLTIRARSTRPSKRALVPVHLPTYSLTLTRCGGGPARDAPHRAQRGLHSVAQAGAAEAKGGKASR